MTDSIDPAADVAAAEDVPEARFVAGRRVRHLSRAELVAAGRAERDRLPRGAIGRYAPAPDRPDPVGILEAQGATRVAELIPIRYGRMLVSPFTFYRGAAAIMASDLGAAPRTTLRTQLCGDAHLANFGVFASPERRLVFDLNDFDETLPGPFEWDVKRLATSFVVAGRSLGWSPAFARQLVAATVTAYQEHMADYAARGALDTWYAHISIADLQTLLPRERRFALDGMEKLAFRKDNLGALSKLTETVDGNRQFRNDPPLLVRAHGDDVSEIVHEVFRAYRSTLSPERRQLLARYRFVDLARKVVGVGSVGTRCWVAYLEGAGPDDPLFLQVKEANASVLEAELGHPPERHHGQRVVRGQRLMQAASDVFLGWVTGPNGPHYYWRQLWDAKLSVDVERLRRPGLLAYSRACGWTLARAHARSGSAVAIAAYMGTGTRFERTMIDFAEAYADQNERDHAALAAAAATGRVKAVSGI
ncbi:MAG TPA: DUF2252 domain-containing protein [Candidatus Limnocylindrales bacterium]|nr:DUF2252 domain-containing protein [Candidatus Limnocylindrales bacterium]